MLMGWMEDISGRRRLDRFLYVVGVVQLAEHWIVVPGVVGSSPITHPRHEGAGVSPVPSFFHLGA